jgi:alanine-glyoxylate transaminase/serine-glyoxylate transaminase/serine-pyruvate transaminase
MEAFGRTLEGLRKVFLAPQGQPFVVAGSGTLAMEMAAANLVEEGDRAVVVDTGYFSVRMGSILERHGAQVTRVPAPPGEVPSLADVETELMRGPTKVLTITHVDTSTGVRAPVKQLAALGKKYGALVVVDGVCSAGGEELRQDDWQVDVALSASQKALGAPPGLAVLVASNAAMEAWRARKTKVRSFYADFSEWLPIMQAYEARKPAYFATPPVNLIEALEASLASILAEGMEARFTRHVRVATAFRAAWKALGLAMLPRTEDVTAVTLSALYYPEGVDASLVGAIRDEGVVVAGGLHPDLRTRYFRVGHMGATGPREILATVGAIERALAAKGHGRELGQGLTAAQQALCVRP